MSKSRRPSKRQQCLGLIVRRLQLAFVLLTGALPGQTLDLPPRPTTAPTGTQFTNLIAALGREERENWIYAQVVSGNVPLWLRELRPITIEVAGNAATYYVTPEYLAIGSDMDYFLAPCTPILAQRLADRLGCSLPTRRMVNQIWTNAAVKLNPQPIPPSPEMITVPVFAWHNFMVRTQRSTFTNTQPLGALTSGDKKDVILSNETTNRPPPARVTIYGWHYPSGEPIQQLSAAHEETYTDYSHGIRLVQSAMWVNGIPHPITSVLRSPSVHSLLSDEGAIGLPRYSVMPLAPIIMSHPRNQSVFAATGVTLSTLAIGDTPLEYQWWINGTPLHGATNSNLVLTNATSANAGHYWIVATNPTGAATSRVAVVRVRTNALPVLVTETFDADVSEQWRIVGDAANGNPDFAVDWAFDYSATPYTFNGITALIPPAPNSPDSHTRAIRLVVNQNDTVATNAALNLYLQNKNFTGNFSMKFDLWIQYPGNSGGTGSGVAGSTQHAIFGINHHGTNANWAASSISTSDGLWFAITGEGGDSKDYRAYAGNASGPATELFAANNTASIFQGLFPAPRFETAGAPGKCWTEVEILQMGDVITWLLDETPIMRRTNTTSFTSGTIMIGLMDVFPSVATPARDSFVLFDNLRMENLSPPPIRFASAARMPSGSVSLTLTNTPGDRYWIDASADLTNWQTLAFVSTTNPLTTLLDSDATHRPARYFRTRR